MKKNYFRKFVFLIWLFNFSFIIFVLSYLPRIFAKRHNIEQRIKVIREQKQILELNSVQLPHQKARVPNDKKTHVLTTSGESARKNQLVTENLKLRLLGIIQGKNASAFIELIDRNIGRIYRVGDRVGPAQLLKILSGQVLLNIRGKEKLLTFDESIPKAEQLPVQKIGKNSLVVKKADVILNVLNIANETNELSVKPVVNKKTKKIEGIMVSDIPQNGFIKKFGLKNFDLIQRINGMQIDSIPKAIRIVSKLKTAKIIEVGLTRNNLPLTLKINITD